MLASWGACTTQDASRNYDSKTKTTVSFSDLFIIANVSHNAKAATDESSFSELFSNIWGMLAQRSITATSQSGGKN